jgi:outer membrane protein assembly factor BamD (BamD/ComL family)
MRSVSSLIIIAAVAFMAGGGCAITKQELVEQPPVTNPARDKFMDAHKLVQDSRYTEAVAAYRLALQEDQNAEWAPEAKYGIALAFVAADNQHRDYSVAAVEFEEFLTQFPADRRAVEAKNWIQAIKVILETKKENDRIRKNIEQLKQLDVKQEEKRKGR